MKKLFYFLSVILILQACNYDPNERNTQKSLVSTNITLNPGGDTNFVSIKYSNISLRINYSENRPKFVLVNNVPGLKNLHSDYAKGNQGVYFAISSANPRNISAVGFKYLNGDPGGDIWIDTANGAMNDITNWRDYNNEGQKYNLSKVGKGRIVVYNLKDGEIADSAVFVRER